MNYKKLLSIAAVFVANFFLTDCAATTQEAIFAQVLSRAQRRNLTVPSTMYSTQHAELVKDVCLSFGRGMDTLEKFFFFERLVSKLGIRALPYGRFKEWAGLVYGRTQEEDYYNRSKMGIQACEVLTPMLKENSRLTVGAAHEALVLKGVHPLPTKPFLSNWISYKRRIFRFVALLDQISTDEEPAEQQGDSSSLQQESTQEDQTTSSGDDLPWSELLEDLTDPGNEQDGEAGSAETGTSKNDGKESGHASRKRKHGIS